MAKKSIIERLEYIETLLELFNDSHINDSGHFDKEVKETTKLIAELKEYEYQR